MAFMGEESWKSELTGFQVTIIDLKARPFQYEFLNEMAAYSPIFTTAPAVS